MKALKKGGIAVGVLLALAVLLASCGAEEQVEVRVQTGTTYGDVWSVVHMVYVAEEPLPFHEVRLNNGTCNPRYANGKWGAETSGLRPKKGQTMTVKAIGCAGGLSVYKVEYITTDGQSWTYNFE